MAVSSSQSLQQPVVIILIFICEGLGVGGDGGGVHRVDLTVCGWSVLCDVPSSHMLTSYWIQDSAVLPLPLQHYQPSCPLSS